MKIACLSTSCLESIKTRYTIEPRDRIHVKGYGFLSFAKNMGKGLSNEYSQKLLDSAKKSTTDAIKTASKRAIQKRAEATGDLIGNKIADKITSVSKKNLQRNYVIMMKQKKMQKQLLIKKDRCLQKKNNILL